MIQPQPLLVPPRSFQRWHTVVLVDDDPQTLAALRRVLAREPYDVVTTDRPALALEWMSRRNISVVISDQRMPEMEGSHFLAEVWKKSPRTRRALLTAYPESLPAPARSPRSLLKVLTKPWNDEELRRTIREMLQSQEEEDEGDGSVSFDLGGEA
jgi:DNA-binding NtrC family response regulator